MATSKIPLEKQCLDCNGAPVGHFHHYFSTSMGLFVSDLFRSKKTGKPMPKFLEDAAIGILLVLNWICEGLDLIQYRTDIENAQMERTRCALREAQKRGIPVELMHVFGKPIDVFRAFIQPKGADHFSWFYFESLPIPPSTGPDGLAWIDDKKLFNKQFTAAGLPVARSIVVTNEKQALAAFRSLGGPVITKPRSGSRARHTTVNIRDEADLIKGYTKAKRLCRYVLVETYIPGSVYRATCIGGKIGGILKLVRPSIVADGAMTVRELFDHNNAHKKYPNLLDVRSNAWLEDAIAHQGYALESVPERGTEIVLAEHSERHNGGYFIDVTEQVPEENKILIERAAALCGVALIGFDIISNDLTRPASVEPMTFIEGNTLPFIEIHLTPYDGTAQDTPKMLWDLWF